MQHRSESPMLRASADIARRQFMYVGSDLRDFWYVVDLKTGDSAARCGVLRAGREALACGFAHHGHQPIAIQETLDGKVVLWLEHVSDGPYRR